jgi:hypothetical protein
MGIREYARHRRVFHPAVVKALRVGRIRLTSGGLIDSEHADIDWGRNTHPAPRAPRAAPLTADGGNSLARGIRDVYLAKLAKLEFEQRAAALVSADKVRVAAAQVQRLFHDHMLAIPGRLAALVAAERAEARVYVILYAAFREALTTFADELDPASVQESHSLSPVAAELQKPRSNIGTGMGIQFADGMVR